LVARKLDIAIDILGCFRSGFRRFPMKSLVASGVDITLERQAGAWNLEHVTLYSGACGKEGSARPILQVLQEVRLDQVYVSVMDPLSPAGCPKKIAERVPIRERIGYGNFHKEVGFCDAAGVGLVRPLVRGLLLQVLGSATTKEVVQKSTQTAAQKEAIAKDLWFQVLGAETKEAVSSQGFALGGRYRQEVSPMPLSYKHVPTFDTSKHST
jgi:hypothetical protein